jgi:uncharacterized protein with HEPN domain
MDRDEQYLLDILESAKTAIRYVSIRTWEDFATDSQCQDAVIRRPEIIGEAARRISEEARNNAPDLPWHEMIGMRNLVIHKYDAVDLSFVWATVHKDLPVLVSKLEQMIPSNQPKDSSSGV